MSHELEHPFAFYGHSMGALIGFELSRECYRRYNVGPLQLFVSGRGPKGRNTGSPIFTLPDDDFVAELRRLNGTPKELLANPETRDLFLPVLRADFKVIGTYEYLPDKLLPCPITAYGGLQDKDVPIESLRAWEKETSAACMVRMLPGDHFFILDSDKDFISVLRADVLGALHSPAMQGA